jgi:VCBS repeat-containing protein
VTAVNDAPSFTKGANQTVLEDAGVQSVANWATNVSAGAANESGQALNFIVTNSNNLLFAVQPAIAANGTLSYTPAANVNGSATVTVQMRDDGGTANGGVDTSPAQTFTINVTAVNDVPSFVKGSNQTIAQGASAQTVTNWATATSAGPADENGQALNFIVTNSNNPLFSSQPAVSATGTLTYTPAAGASGSATVTVALHDNGGVANGGVDTSASQTFTITITASSGNRAPVAVNDSYTTNQASALTRTAPGVLANDTDPDAGDTRTAVLAGAPIHGTLTLNANGSFTYNPSANYSGTDTFRYQAKDAAGALSNIATVSITIVPFSASIAPVNDSTLAANDSPAATEASVVAVLAFGGVPAHGTLTPPAASSFSYAPNGTFSGPDLFHFPSKDVAARSKVATGIPGLNL